MELRDARTDKGTPVPTLDSKALVAQNLGHQLEHEFGDSSDVHSRRSRTLRKSVSRQGGSHHRKRVALVSSVSVWLRQHWNQCHEFVHRTRPAVKKKQRFRVRPSAALMDEVNF